MPEINKEYDEGAGIQQGPFKGCDCPSHHCHGPQGEKGCPVCNPKEWPKKKASEPVYNGRSELIRYDPTPKEIEYNQALSEAWEVHQRVVGEKDRCIARLTSELTESHDLNTSQAKRIAELEEAIDNKNCDIKSLCDDLEDYKAKAERYGGALREIGSVIGSPALGHASAEQRYVEIEQRLAKLSLMVQQALGGK